MASSSCAKAPARAYLLPPPLPYAYPQVHVDTDVDTCRQWNAARPEGERYPPEMWVYGEHRSRSEESGAGCMGGTQGQECRTRDSQQGHR